ncbi:MAG: hypothetical protein HXS48_27885 [Theionarchaea archaeon]|nr:hypothetical protein [Theionarchaea archaeon]
MVKDMCIYSPQDEYRLTHCMHRTLLEEPRLYYDDLGKRCDASRNTVTKYWKQGMEKKVFFPPQIRLKMFENRKEYIYLVQSDEANKLFEYFKNKDELVYMSYVSGKFDILLQTNRLLDVLPDGTLFYGGRSNYIYPDTPFRSYVKALDLMEDKLGHEYSKSKIMVEYPLEPVEIGNPHYGWMIFPHIKYNLRVSYTNIVKTLHISFESFQKGLEYLFNVSTVLLPYYPLGFRLYSQYFFVFWSNYEKFLCELFSCLPCHTSITKVKDALIMYVSIQKGEDMSERLFKMCSTMVDLGFINRFWSSKPIYRWRRD